MKYDVKQGSVLAETLEFRSYCPRWYEVKFVVGFEYEGEMELKTITFDFKIGDDEINIEKIYYPYHTFDIWKDYNGDQVLIV